MTTFKKGMFVRCPVDDDYPDNPRRFALGKIREIDEVFENLIVEFIDFQGIIKYYPNMNNVREYSFNKVSRCRILNSSFVRYSGYEGKILSFLYQSEEGYNVYYIELYDSSKKQIIEISEKKLRASLTQMEISPIEQLKNYEFHNPKWYLKRRVVSKLMNIIRNSSYGFEYLVGSRVHLLPHQVETVVRVLSDNECRFMLADEVGLGKTIEACAILKGLKERTETLNTMLIIPESLAAQWKNELLYKFNLDVDIWNPDKPVGINIIIPMELVTKAHDKGVFDYDWDICIVDETHNLLKKNDEYKVVEGLSKKIEHILLLSATPVLERKMEYLNLLKLLKPDVYGNMSEEEFSIMVNKQTSIQERVYPLIEDLQDYFEEGYYEDYLYDLQDIEGILQDDFFSQLVNEIDIQTEDKGLKAVKLCLAYLSEYYQMERRVIRHRRQILKEIMPQRTLEVYPYEMRSADTLFYEYNVYDKIKEFISKHLQDNIDKDKKYFIKRLLSAMFSSPWALEEVLDELSTRKIKGHKEDILELSSLLERWNQAVNNEFTNFEQLYDYPDKIQGRLLYILDYLQEQLDDTKIVIFTQFTSTLLKFEKLLKNCFGPEAFTTFHKGLDGVSLQSNADKFQNDTNCRFILCDELGGEGRNFQIADQIIHVDIPWAANDLEQRIGRLDRLGRKTEKDVLSIVFYAQNTIEEDLFNIWNKGLNIFNKSLSGLEIILGELNDLILNSLSSDLNYGLTDTVDRIIEKTNEMRNEIKKEEYFDIASQLDKDTEDMLYNLIQSFTLNDGQALYSSMMSWASMTGLHSSAIGRDKNIIVFDPGKFSRKSAQHTLLVPPNWDDYNQYLDNRRAYDIRGTFNRKLAITREDILFFAPDDPVFESIVNNAMSCDLGRCTALALKNDYSFKGFIFTWSINPEINHLLELNEELIYLTKFRGYLPLEQLVSVIPVDDESRTVESFKTKVISDIEKHRSPNEIGHLGRRGIKKDFLNIISLGKSNSQWFKEQIPNEVWQELIDKSLDKSLKEVQEHIKYQTNLRGAKKELDKILYAQKASQMFFNNSSTRLDRLQKIHEAILKGIKESKPKLDSASFIWMVKKND